MHKHIKNNRGAPRRDFPPGKGSAIIIIGEKYKSFE
jgi:hypothetical protein